MTFGPLNLTAHVRYPFSLFSVGAMTLGPLYTLLTKSTPSDIVYV